jgi:hypothetical protein
MLVYYCRSVLLVLTILFGTSIVESAAEILPAEPCEEHLVNEDVNIVTGLYTREYSLRGDGVIDYRTARQIIRSEYNDYGDTVVEATPYPLFYWYDAVESGRFSMWIDPKGEGCGCDIVPYIALTGDFGQ